MLSSLWRLKNGFAGAVVGWLLPKRLLTGSVVELAPKKLLLGSDAGAGTSTGLMRSLLVPNEICFVWNRSAGALAVS